LSFPAATTPDDDFVGVVESDTIDANGDTEDLGHERNREVLLQHRQEGDTLFRVAVGINNRFFNQSLKLTLGQPRR
jgi:hypothetical protein